MFDSFSSIKTHQRATTIKLMHEWIPTYASLCRQERESSSICPRCHSTVETKEHLLICPLPEAIHHRILLLNTFINTLRHLSTPTLLIHIFEYKLLLVLDVPFNLHHKSSIEFPPIVLTAIRHKIYQGGTYSLMDTYPNTRPQHIIYYQCPHRNQYPRRTGASRLLPQQYHYTRGSGRTGINMYMEYPGS